MVGTIKAESDAELYSKANDLIEDIFKFKRERCGDLSLIETVIEYGYKNDIPIQELGNILADHKDYVSMFRKQLTKDGFFREDEEIFDIRYNDEEW